MEKITHIFNRFEWWSVADCACEFCLYWEERKRVCTLPSCACEDVREEAVRREQEAADALVRHKEAMMLCPV